MTESAISGHKESENEATSQLAYNYSVKQVYVVYNYRVVIVRLLHGLHVYTLFYDSLIHEYYST